MRARQFSNEARGGGPGSLGEALRSGGAQIQKISSWAETTEATMLLLLDVCCNCTDAAGRGGSRYVSKDFPGGLGRVGRKEKKRNDVVEASGDGGGFGGCQTGKTARPSESSRVTKWVKRVINESSGYFGVQETICPGRLEALEAG